MSCQTLRRVTAAVAVMVGSALLFGVQPLTGRLLLPHYGGSASVWVVCLGAFQLLLLAGYSYAAWLCRRPLAFQPLFHLAILVAALVWPGWGWIRRGAMGTAFPSLQVLMGVLAGPGPAYVALAAGTTLMQSWLSRCEGGAVYRLYALSNIGALVGLFVYPFLLEPFLSLTIQIMAWRVVFLLYIVMVVILVWFVSGADSNVSVEGGGGFVSGGCEGNERVFPWPAVGWWGLPALSAFLLTSATASLTLDVVPLPLLWAILLAVFLLSYVVGFSRWGERYREGWALLALMAVVFQGSLRALGTVALVWNLMAGVLLIFFGGVFLHGWLYRLRPEPARLSDYYLGIAGGGAAGGLLAALGAPLLFADVYEYPLAVFVLALLACFRLGGRSLGRTGRMNGRLVWAVAGFLAVLMGVGFWKQGKGVQFRSRNFYGVVRIQESEIRDPYGNSLGRLRALVHGQTTHGAQALAAGLREQPTMYYGPGGGGFPIVGHPKRRAGEPIRVGMVGLGVGTLALYGRSGDRYRFYEIDSQVVALARDSRWFTFLADSEAEIEIVEGDARLSLEREKRLGEPGWDVLIVDAFSGDAVPLHLLTREAVALCLERLTPGGVVAFHVSNRYVDLLPLLKAQARAAGVAFWVWGNLTRHSLEAESRWVAMAREPQPWWHGMGDVVEIAADRIPDYPVVTDEYGSAMRLVDWRRRAMERYVAEERARRKKAGGLGLPSTAR